MKRLIKTKALILCALFVALISIGAFIKLPIPPIPVTLQMLFVLLAGQLLKPAYTAIALLGYILLGLIGLPVFSGGGGGSYILHPTFGYIIGFLVGAVLISVLTKKKNLSYFKLLFANFAGLAVIYIFGITYFYLVNTLYLSNNVDSIYMLVSCFLVFIPSDIAFCFLSAELAKRLKKIIF